MRPSLGKPIAYGFTGIHKRLELARRFVSWQAARVLDVGCGNGAYTLEIAQEAAYVCGIDIEPERLGEFAARAMSVSNVSVGQAFGERLPLRDASFDVVFCIETLEHVADERLTLRGMYRVLKPGGSLVLIVPNKWYLFETHGLRPRWLKKSNRYPFASWLPHPIHSRLANARIYTARDIRRLLDETGWIDMRLEWMLPPLDLVRSRLLREGLRRLLAVGECTPLKRFGVSLIAAATKPRYAQRGFHADT